LQGTEAMMRNESGFSHQPTSRAARLVVLVSTIGIVLIAAWGFAPLLLANSAQTIVAPPRATVVQPIIAPAIATAPKAAATLEQAPALTAAAPADATTALATRWSNDADVPPELPSLAARALMKAVASVPLPRKRPSLTMAARLAIPMPRPRPEMEADAASDELSALELQVQRQR
jgi:hypothetical protein